jgi:hypothetical protein
LNYIPKLGALLGLTLALGCGAKGTARIAIDSTRTHQTINGWEATVAIDDDGLNPTTRDSLIAVAVDQYGITRLRLQAQGNVIESVDHTHYPPELAIGSNDNDDPNVMVPERFWWQIFDRHVKDYVLPIKARVEARGDRFVLNVCFVGFRASSRFLQENPAEYVEFMLAVLNHLKTAYSTPLEPDLWEMRLEPDNGAVRMSPDQMGEYLVAAGNAARKAGFQKMRFSMPSTKDPNLVPEYVQGVLKHPGAAAYITELSYHRYRTPLPATFDQLRGLSKEHAGLPPCWSTSGAITASWPRISPKPMCRRGPNTLWSGRTAATTADTISTQTVPWGPGRWDTARRHSRSSSITCDREPLGWKRRATIRNSCR